MKTKLRDKKFLRQEAQKVIEASILEANEEASIEDAARDLYLESACGRDWLDRLVEDSWEKERDDEYDEYFDGRIDDDFYYYDDLGYLNLN